MPEGLDQRSPPSLDAQMPVPIVPAKTVYESIMTSLPLVPSALRITAKGVSFYGAIGGCQASDAGFEPRGSGCYPWPAPLSMVGATPRARARSPGASR
jgi:hypothetical protein